MHKEQILRIIEDEAKQQGWTLDEALHYLSTIGFHIDKVTGNELVDERRIRESVRWAKYALS
jgi:hypothetical protein